MCEDEGFEFNSKVESTDCFLIRLPKGVTILLYV